MLVLAFDTSSASGSIALIENSSLRSEWTAGNVGTHADWLMHSISSFLENASTDIKDIDRFAIGIGPGSFTGLRIGISTVKGFAWALGKEVIGVSTLKALAMNLMFSQTPVCPVFDARKKEVYTAIYKAGTGGMNPVLDDCVIAPEKLCDFINDNISGPVVFLGSGLSAYGELFSNRVKNAVFAPEPFWHPKASNIGLLALEEGRPIRPEHIAPVYLRKSEAELKEALKKTP